MWQELDAVKNGKIFQFPLHHGFAKQPALCKPYDRHRVAWQSRLYREIYASDIREEESEEFLPAFLSLSRVTDENWKQH